MTLVCPDCFNQVGLRRRIVAIRPSFEDAQCDFHPTKKGVPIAAVAEIVDEVFRSNYTFGDYDPRSDDFRGDDLLGTLYELTEADDHEVIAALADALIEGDNYWPPDGEEAFYDDERTYILSEAGFEEHSYTWATFRQEILHEQRFFNQRALERLKKIFDGLHLLRDEVSNPAVYEIRPGDDGAKFFRARKANSINERRSIALDPAGKLGPPPEKLRRAGRMNSAGIPAFYGAFDTETCVAELRPAVGESVIFGSFELTRPILVLDTTRFMGRPQVQNVFAQTYVVRMKLWRFMAAFMNEIAKPSLPEDEHLDYISTQVVSEYLTHLHKFKHGNGEKTIDAIIYRSAQNGSGKNIAIFGDAGTVAGKEASFPFLLRRGKPALRVLDDSVKSLQVTSVRFATRRDYTPSSDDDEPDF